MASEIRVNRLSNRSGLSTITFANGGVQFSGITTFANGEFYVGTGATIINPGTNEFNFHTGGSNRFTINNSGANLGTGNITAVDATFTGNVSIGKTLTYEDVKNVDSVGVVTARTGVKITGGDFTVGTAITASSVTGNVTQDVGITTFSGSATWFKGLTANKDMYWSKSSGSLVFKDNAQILMGDSSDLQIYHSGSHSFIKDAGTGMLKICADMLDIRNAADNATLAYAQEGNKFELFYNGSAKLATTNTGVTVTGTMNIANSAGQSHYQITQVSGNTVKFGIVSGSDIELSGSSNNSMYFKTNNTERLRIHTTGQVEFKNGSFSNNVNCVMASGSTLEIGATATIKLRTATNERLQIDSNGSVHVGFSGESLFFQNASNNSNARIQNAGASNNSNLRFLTRNAGTEAERLRIDSTGRLIVGASTNSIVDPFKVAIKETSGENAAIVFLDTDNMKGGICGIAKGTDQILTGTTNVDFIIGSSYADTHIISGNGSNSTGYIRATATTNGAFVVGHTASRDVGSTAFGRFQVHNSNSIVNAAIASYGNNSGGAILSLGHSRHATVGSVGVALQSNDEIASIRFAGDDGTDMENTACSIIGKVDGSVSSNSVPGRLEFHAGGTEKLRITSGGDVSVSGDGTVHGISKLTIKPANRTTAFSASDGDTWHDVVIKHEGDAANNAVGLAFEVSPSAYHKNAGTGIAAVKNGTGSDYGSDLVFITRGQSVAASEKLRITSTGQIVKSQGANVTSLKTYNSNADAFTLDHYQLQSSGTYQRYTDIVSIGDGSWGSNIRFFTNANGSANGIERLRINSLGRLMLGPDAQDIQIIPHSTASGHGQIYFRGNASNESSSIKLNHYGHADYVIGAGRHSNGMFSITRSDTGTDGLLMNTSGRIKIGGAPETLTGNGVNAKLQVNTGASNDYDGIMIGGGYTRSTIQNGATYDLILTSNAYPANATSKGIRFKCGTSGGGGPNERMRIHQDGMSEWRQHGGSKTYEYRSSVTGSYNQCIIIADCHAYHSFSIEVDISGYAYKYVWGKYYGYENGALYSAGNPGHQDRYSSSQYITHSHDGGHKHKFLCYISSATHPQCGIKITVGGPDAYIDTGDLTFAWS